MNELIHFKCSACGKALKAKPELGGKRSRCPCGQTVTIPHHASSDSSGDPPQISGQQPPSNPADFDSNRNKTIDHPGSSLLNSQTPQEQSSQERISKSAPLLSIQPVSQPVFAASEPLFTASYQRLDIESPAQRERRLLLDQMRNALGVYEYNRLVDTLGEDGILDLMRQPFPSTSTPAPAKDKAAGTWAAKIGDFLLSALLGVAAPQYLLWPMMMVSCWSASGPAKLAAGICTIIGFGIILGWWAKSLQEDQAKKADVTQPDVFWAALGYFAYTIYFVGMFFWGIVYVIWGIIQMAS